MPEVTSFTPGDFCWFELATTDQNGAKQFYSNLFGWTPNDMPMGPDAVYTMLEKNGKQVGALYGMGPDKAGMPPHWSLYIATDDVDASAKRAEELGARVIVPPFDVMDVGRMAGIQDPTGAVFMMWQAKRPGGMILDEENSFCWYELQTNDPDRAKDFYTKLFGWEAGGSPEYTEWKKGGKSIGGMMKIQPEWGPVPPNWSAYVMVNSADAIAERAKSLGGNVIMGPADIPGTGRFAVLADPQGAVIAAYEPLKK